MNNATALLIFALSLVVLLLLAKKNLWLAFFSAALILGFLSLPAAQLLVVCQQTICDGSILLLSLAVGLIPMIGGVLEKGGLIDTLVSSLNITRRLFVALAPAALGMLPMPGGALLSVPLVQKAGDDIPGELKAAVNVWFRHVLVLVYPLGTLLASCKLAKVDLYQAVLYTIPFFLLMLLTGYWGMLKAIAGRMPGARPLTFRAVGLPLGIILLAPGLHFTLRQIWPAILNEIHLVIGVSASLGLAIWCSQTNRSSLWQILQKVKPWNYALLILGVFLFKNVFQQSGITDHVISLTNSPFVLLIVVGMLLGFGTGRVMLPVAILVPLIARTGIPQLSAFDFALMHFAIFIGYLISPVHPCVLVSMQYFETAYPQTFRKLLPASLVCFLLVSLIALLKW